MRYLEKPFGGQNDMLREYRGETLYSREKPCQGGSALREMGSGIVDMPFWGNQGVHSSQRKLQCFALWNDEMSSCSSHHWHYDEHYLQ